VLELLGKNGWERECVWWASGHEARLILKRRIWDGSIMVNIAPFSDTQRKKPG